MPTPPDPHDVHFPDGERLQRVLASRGVASRRASEQLITEGRVAVNGIVVTELGTRVNPVSDEITVDGQPIKRQRPRFLMLNKPSGFITTVSDEKQRWTVMDLIEVDERVYPVGRLDRETQGLLLLTNVGDVANRVMHPRYKLDKEYQVITHRRPTAAQLSELREGILVDGRMIVPDECRLLREASEGIVIKIVIHEGLYHVVRKMMEIVGVDVVKLRRVRVGPLSLSGIPTGAWRDLTAGELLQLYEAIDLPVEDAVRINKVRPLITAPVGGFSRAPQNIRPRRGRATPADGGEWLPGGDCRHSGSGPRRTGSARPTNGPARGPRYQERNGHGSARPPHGHRHRRPGGSR